MRLTMHLVRKELRDARWIAIGVAAATAGIVFATLHAVPRIFGNGELTPEIVAAFVPVWAALGGALAGSAVAAEAFAGDAISRRIEGAALLPVSLGRVFAAKLAATLVAWGLAAAWTTAVACLAATAVGGSFEKLAGGGGFVALAGLASLPVVLAVALLAAVLEHGLGAVLGGTLLVGGAGFSVFRTTPWEEWGLRPQEGDVLVAAVPVALVLAVATWLAFVKGPIHLGWRIRRAALGLGTALGVLVGGGAAAAAVLDARVDVAPGDPDAEITGIHVSPDGKHAVLIVGNGRAPVTSQAWSVRLADGNAIRVPGRYWTFEKFEDAARAAFWAATRKDRSSRETLQTVDLDTGAIVRTRSIEQASAAWTDTWLRTHRHPDGVVVEWPARGVKLRIDGAWNASASPREGRLLVWKFRGLASVVDLDSGVERALPPHSHDWGSTWGAEGRTLRFTDAERRSRELDCETGEIRELVPPAGSWARFSEGPYGAYHPDKNTVSIADLRDGRVVAGPWEKRAVEFVAGSDRHAITYNGPEPTTLLDLSTGREVPIVPNPNSYGYPPNLIHALPDATFLLVRPGNGLDVIDATGKTLRTLLPASR